MMDFIKCSNRLLGRTLVLLFFLFSTTIYADTIKVAVLIPEIKGSFSTIFENMMSGIEEIDDIQAISKRISIKTTPQEIDDWLVENQIQTIVALGRGSYQLANKLESSLPVTVGALVVSPNGHSGISLAGDPDKFLHHLQDLAPEVKRVFIVYSKKNTGWLIEHAEKAAQARGIELIAFEANNIKEGVKYYDEILHQTNSDTDAIWIPLDRIVPDKTILPKILKEAWNRNLVIFSNNPLHTKKGTLFSLFPDHKLMGKSLAQLAIDQLKTQSGPKVLPAKNLKLAVNSRTASHLGLHYSKSKKREFDLVFPSR